MLKYSKLIFPCASGHQKRYFSVYVATEMVMNFYIDEKDEERERARLSRDGEGRAFHPTPPPTPSHLNEVRELGEGWEGGGGGGGWGRGVRALR